MENDIKQSNKNILKIINIDKILFWLFIKKDNIRLNKLDTRIYNIYVK